MKRALVPFDGSDNALRAVAYAAKTAQEKPTLKLELLHVVDPMPLRSNAAMTQEEIHKIYASEADRVRGVHELDEFCRKERVDIDTFSRETNYRWE